MPRRSPQIQAKADLVLSQLLERDLSSQDISNLLGGKLRGNEIALILKHIEEAGYLVWEDRVGYMSSMYGLLRMEDL